jgi:hypothetical protein
MHDAWRQPGQCLGGWWRAVQQPHRHVGKQFPTAQHLGMGVHQASRIVETSRSMRDQQQRVMAPRPGRSLRERDAPPAAAERSTPSSFRRASRRSNFLPDEPPRLVGQEIASALRASQ